MGEERKVSSYYMRIRRGEELGKMTEREEDVIERRRGGRRRRRGRGRGRVCGYECTKDAIL